MSSHSQPQAEDLYILHPSTQEPDSIKNSTAEYWKILTLFYFGRILRDWRYGIVFSKIIVYISSSE